MMPLEVGTLVKFDRSDFRNKILLIVERKYSWGAWFYTLFYENKTLQTPHEYISKYFDIKTKTWKNISVCEPGYLIKE